MGSHIGSNVYLSTVGTFDNNGSQVQNIKIQKIQNINNGSLKVM